MVLPVQPNIRTVVGSKEAVTSDSAISDFLELDSTSGRGALSDTYDPWLGLDQFGRADILSKLDPGNRFQCKIGKEKSTKITQVQQPPSNLRYSKKTARTTRLLSDAEVTQESVSMQQ